MTNTSDNIPQTPPASPQPHPQPRWPPELMTEEELIGFLRIPHVTKAKDHHNVVANLKRMHDLPRIHICGQPLYPREAIQEWIRNNTTNDRK